MAKERWKLTQTQWEKIEPLLPKPNNSRRGGRPWADNRKVFEGIFLGTSHRCTLGRFAQTVSKSFNLLAPAEIVGGARYLD